MSVIDCAKRRRNLLLFDTFAGVDTTSLAGRYPDINKVGAAWFSSIGDITLATNRAVALTLTANLAISIIDCGTADGIATMLWKSGSMTGTTDYGILIFRYQDANNYWSIQFGKVSGVGTFRLVEVVNNVATVQQSTTVAYSSTTNYLFWVSFEGGTINARLNGATTLAHTTAATGLTATTIGIGFRFAGTITTYPRIDDLQVYGL